MLDALARQPKSVIWLCTLLVLAVVGVVDYVTPWKFSLFMFYAFDIFIVAWTLGRNAALPFAALCVAVSWFTNVGSYPLGDLRDFAWSTANRAVGFLFVAICGNAVLRSRTEAQARVAAMENSRRLEQEIVRTGESEKRRIGQDLHDGVCQTLSAISCATECLKRDLQDDGVPHAASAAQIQRLLAQAILELRGIAWSMSPVNLTSDGLPTSIEALVAMTNQLRQSSVTFHADSEVRFFDPAAAIHLYRIAQEALSNAMKHANAAHVDVTLKRAGGLLTLAIADDGRGLPAAVGQSEGMGFHTMEYRANLIGAQFALEKSATGGLLVKCTLRVPEPAEAACNETVKDTGTLVGV